MHVVGFVIRIYDDARSPERLNYTLPSNKSNPSEPSSLSQNKIKQNNSLSMNLTSEQVV